MKHEVKTDCFGYHKTAKCEKCDALRELYCKTGECNFYRPLTECEKDPKSYYYKGERGMQQ